MTTRIITETPGQRNRRLFVKALRAGCAVVWEREDGGEYRVSSTSRAGQVHTVELDSSEDGQNIISCSCEWMRGRWMLNSGKSPLCGHANLVRWHRLSIEDQDAIIAVAPDIAAAVFTSRYAGPVAA